MPVPLRPAPHNQLSTHSDSSRSKLAGDFARGSFRQTAGTHPERCIVLDEESEKPRAFVRRTDKPVVA
jgi:hypothetical protein